ncbi:MAG: outer membrane beta-barrel protein [Bacteroidales bacterium]|nr:outer membrane beta-barrel protein [Bacteroidales bacterium]
MNGNTGDFSIHCSYSEGCTFKFDVATNAPDYTITSGGQSWISFVEKEKESFHVLVEPNRLTRMRTANFVVQAGKKRINVKLTQAGQTIQHATYLLLDGSPDDQELRLRGADGGHATYAVSTDTADFIITGVPSWVTISNKTMTSFTVNVAPNTTSSERNDYFVVKAGSKTVKVVVRQPRRARSAAEGGIRIDAGIGMLVSTPHVSFKGPDVGGVINYGVNNLTSAGTKPDYSSGIGFEFHGNVSIPIVGGFGLSTGLAFSFHHFSNKFRSSDWSFTTDNWSHRYSVEQSSTEKFSFTYMDIPALATYSFDVAPSQTLTFKGGLVFGVGLSGKTKMSSQIEYTYNDGSGNYLGTTYKSSVSQTVNLFTGEYSYAQRYTSGSSETYDGGSTTTSPFNRFNLQLRLGADYAIGRFLFGVTYNIGLSNIANEQYFESVNNQIGGFFHAGDPQFVSSTDPLEKYKHRNSSLLLSVGYIF